MVKKILIYSDGASKGNPGPGGWGAVVALEDKVVELGGHEAHTTNNRMELMAAFEALKFLAAQNQKGDIVFRTDSAYVIKGATMWKWGWRKNNWMTKEGTPVVNKELWEQFANLTDEFHPGLKWENVGGHVGIPGNERVDEIASTFATQKKFDLYSGPKSSYPVDLESVVVNTDQQKKKSDTRAKSKLPAYSYVSAVGGVVLTHKTWDECKQRVQGKKARFKKSTSAADEAKIISEFSSH